ncbi:uncharacterized protein LOC129249867 [Anastrepha obliqua]|uniref:uncharacterized protein LOC129249867 n=1 Tax=Anastrepha obliqua TaxID=95512 RepID=UPI00240928F5|nr:uncharacterized protein LOC129249867 [Anastrepha obliqua]
MNTSKHNVNTVEVVKIAASNPSLDLPKETADGSNSSGELVKNPFQRSSRLAHSPPLIGRTRSASPCMQYSSVAKEATTEELNRSISAKIKELTEMMELSKRNINQPMRDLVSSISELHKKLERSILTSRIRMLKGTKSVVLEAKNECTQTSPLIKRVTDGTPKRCIDTVAARKSPAKKSKSDRDGTLKATPVSTKEQTSSEGWSTQGIAANAASCMEDDGNRCLANADEILHICKQIKGNKAPGPDAIPNEALKLAIQKHSEIFVDVYNSCLEECTFPKEWKLQKLVLIPKGSKPAENPSGYRPLCLLDTAGKILERLIVNRLESSIDSAGGLSPHQFGFRKTRLTTDAVIAG